MTLRTGAPWRDLPAELGDWHTTFVRFRRWTRSERWDGLLQHVSADLQLRAVFIDSTIVRVHSHAATVLADKGYDAAAPVELLHN